MSDPLRSIVSNLDILEWFLSNDFFTLVFKYGGKNKTLPGSLRTQIMKIGKYGSIKARSVYMCQLNLIEILSSLNPKKLFGIKT